MTTPQLYHCLRSTDADRTIAFLTALGFTEKLVFRDPEDPTIVHHAQFQWRDHGGLMLGSVRGDEEETAPWFRPGASVCNLVVPSDEQVDEVLRRGVEAGGRVAAEPSEPPHGGRTAGILDHDGNYWNIDSYPGE
ncbi:VOC family protein [Brachybacterium sp. p3-SID1565]|uniref:VOC family protein n=1 Tax=unclassified Brachybacterium TaxID=2623841 RepID=UPI0021AA3C8A|nr:MULTISPECIES: VOC family protein [unclassified Brachybacterium]MCT1386140.1 VOC family protein [Brachybacterium sp. p3-SID1565]MCT1776054.1 VOC family protein [Brachybacterium sp. p3-SID957]